MRPALLLLVAFVEPGSLAAQTEAPATCEGVPYELAERLLGTWQEYEVTPEGNSLSGTLTVTLEGGGCALTQHFASTDGSFSFRSLGHVDRETGSWVETFVLSNGRVTTYHWSAEGDDIIFRRAPHGNSSLWRLRATDWTPASFLVVGEESLDQGESWQAVDQTLTVRLPDPSEHPFDHIVVAISDLEVGIQRFAELAGVRAEFGGEHPDLGTHNALVSLGAGSYLEIISTRSDAEASESQLASWISGIEELTPIMWAVTTTDIEASRATLAAAGFETSEPSRGSRRTADGRLLEWSTFGLLKPQLAAAPFFIQWSPTTPHPSITSPFGCELSGLEIVSNDNDTMRRLLDVLGVGAVVAEGPQPEIRLGMNCPAGPVALPVVDR